MVNNDDTAGNKDGDCDNGKTKRTTTMTQRESSTLPGRRFIRLSVADGDGGGA